MIKEAIILAGGLGTRLQSVVSDVPKPMAPINEKPFLSYLLQYLEFSGIQKVILSVGHLHEVIAKHFGNRFNSVRIEYAIEKERLGTGGAMRCAIEKCQEETLLALNGDSFFDVNLSEFYRFHTENKSDFSLALRKINDASRYGKIEIDELNRIIKFKEKEENIEDNKIGLINGGVYLFDKKKFLNNIPKETIFSLEKDFFEKKISSIKIMGLPFDGYFIDIGIPIDYQKANHEFEKFPY